MTFKNFQTSKLTWLLLGDWRLKQDVTCYVFRDFKVFLPPNRSQASDPNSSLSLIFSSEDVTGYVLGWTHKQDVTSQVSGTGGQQITLILCHTSPSWQRKPVSCFWPQFWCQRFVLLAAMPSPKLPDIFNRISLFVRFLLISFACNLLELNSQTFRILKWFNATAKST